jgi:hypothetical protein
MAITRKKFSLRTSALARVLVVCSLPYHYIKIMCVSPGTKKATTGEVFPEMATI